MNLNLRDVGFKINDHSKKTKKVPKSKHQESLGPAGKIGGLGADWSLEAEIGEVGYQCKFNPKMHFKIPLGGDADKWFMQYKCS